MKLDFQKSLKRATALALIFSISYPASLSASNVTLNSWDGIGENDSLTSIAGRGVRVNRIEQVRGMRDGQNPSRIETVPYSYGVQAAETDLMEVKNFVIASDRLAYPERSDVYKNALKQKIKNAFRDTTLRELPPHSYHDVVESISSDIFKASQNHLAGGEDRNDWARDNGLGGYFTFSRNKNGKVSLIIQDLNVVLPLFTDQRLAEIDSWLPYGVVPNRFQQDTASLLSLLLVNRPNGLKAGVRHRIQNPQEGLEDAWYFLQNGRRRPLAIEQPLVVYAGGYPRANIAGQLSPELEQAMRIAFPPLIEQIKTYCGYVSPRVGNAQIFDKLYDPFIEMVLERFVALKQNVRNSPYLMANTTPYGMEQDILRRFELYKRQTSAYNEWTQNPSVYGLQKAVDAYIGWRIPPALVKTGFDLWKQYTGYENTLDGVQWIKTKEGSVGIKDPQTGLSYPIFAAERLSHENFLAEDQPMDGNGLNGMISFMGDYIKQDENMKLAHVKAPLESLCYIIHETYLEMVKDHLNNRPWKEDRKRQVLMDKAEKHMQLTGISYLDQKTPRYKNGVYVKAGLMPRMLGHEVYMLPKMDKYKNDFENRYVQSFLGTQWYKLLDDQEFYFKSKK